MASSARKLAGLKGSGNRKEQSAKAREAEGAGASSRLKAVPKAFHSLRRRRRLTQSNFFKGIVTSNPRYDRGTKSWPRSHTLPRGLASRQTRNSIASLASDRFSISVPTKKLLRTSGRFILHSGFNFSALELSRHELIESCVSMLMESILSAVKPGLPESDIRQAMREFVLTVERNYVNTSYHSFYHATDVLQSMYFFISEFLTGLIDRETKFMLLVVSLLHDVGHPGGSIKLLHENGVFRKHRSLEAYHVIVATRIVKDSWLFSDEFFAEKTVDKLLGLLEFLILATDMSLHEEVLQVASTVTVPEKGPMPEEHLAVLIKLCDVVNVVRHFRDARLWSIKLAVEFGSAPRLQQKEDKEDCPCDLCSRLSHNGPGEKTIRCVEQEFLAREGPEMSQVAQDTTMFINGLVCPIVDHLKDVSEDLYNKVKDRLEHNLSEWELLME